MSRIGLKPINIPSGVEIKVDGQSVSVKGGKGTLSLLLPAAVILSREGETINLSVAHPTFKSERALWGTFRALLQNMIKGVTVGFTRSLEVNGVGYRANVSGKKLVLEVGYSHEIDFPLPEGVTATVDKNIVSLSGADKQLVGETAARLRRVRPPEPYKGTGIKFVEEIVRRKAGKAGKAGAA
jgi:large subunit ribosomal protein L6